MAYRLTHPQSKTEIEVEKDMVPMYASQGWQTKPTAPPVETPDEKPAKGK